MQKRHGLRMTEVSDKAVLAAQKRTAALI
jgi:hypothetical protein